MHSFSGSWLHEIDPAASKTAGSAVRDKSHGLGPTGEASEKNLHGATN
jgi:hypothetical protein